MYHPFVELCTTKVSNFKCVRVYHPLLSCAITSITFGMCGSLNLLFVMFKSLLSLYYAIARGRAWSLRGGKCNAPEVLRCIMSYRKCNLYKNCVHCLLCLVGALTEKILLIIIGVQRSKRGATSLIPSFIVLC